MFDLIPDVLSRAHRGICPTCGAAMPLAESGRQASCEFCGGSSELQHRLRAVEASAGELNAPRIKGATRWLRKQARYESCTCPGCGAEFQADTEHSIQTCQYCGTQSKLETRLVAITPADVDPPQCRTRADLENQKRGRLDYPWSVGTEQLIWRVINEPDLMRRVNLAQRFQNWGYINHTAVHFLPWLLRHVNTDEDVVAIAACDVVGKLLCQGDPTLWPGTIQACRGAIFDVRAKRTILNELGLGKGVCVKTLIDAAEYASTHGDRDYACHALWAVNTLIGRNFGEHPTIAEIVLYRLFYVTGPVLGWALYTMRNSYLRGRYPWQTLARAIDELAAERPEVVPHLLECVYTRQAEAPEEYRERIAFIRNARSWGGRAAAAEGLGLPPEHDEGLYAEAFDALEPVLDDPQAAASADTMIYRMICERRDRTPAAANELVRRRGESLSHRVKREFIRRNPQTTLLDTSVRYNWQSDPKRELDPEMDRLLQVWKEGINAAVDAYRSRVKELQPQREEARKLEVEVFLDDGPATLPLGEEYARKQREQQQREQDFEDQQNALAELQQDYQQRIEELSQKMMANMDNQQAIQKYSQEMTRLTTEMQDKVRRIAEG